MNGRARRRDGGGRRFPTLGARAKLGRERRIIERRRLGRAARPALAEIGEDDIVGGLERDGVLRRPGDDVEDQRAPVEVEVEALAVAGRRGVDGLAGRFGISVEEDPVGGEPLRRGDGERIAVLETDAAVIIPYLVVMEAHLAPRIGAPGDEHAVLALLERLDSDDSAVEQAPLPMGRADAKTLAHGDVERHGRLAAVGVVNGHGHGGALIAWGQVDFAHARRERPALRVGARKHRGALARLLTLIPRPVRDQARKRRLIVRAKMHPAPRVVGEERAPVRRRPETPPRRLSARV